MADGHRSSLVRTGQTNVNMALSALFSALEVVPLTLLTLDAWDFVRTTRGDRDAAGKPMVIPHKLTFYFLMAVGFWNFVGAGILGFLINLPIVSYEVGTLLTPAHGHAAMMGVFGMLAIALMVFVLRQTSSDAYWHARSLDYIGSERSHLIEWLRMPGDVVFIVFGAVPLTIAALKSYFNLRTES